MPPLASRSFPFGELGDNVSGDPPDYNGNHADPGDSNSGSGTLNSVLDVQGGQNNRMADTLVRQVLAEVSSLCELTACPQLRAHEDIVT
ncbi:hypothetical protein VTN00DRAFT_4023 [Thermoascus crustaceus]|uniref:uncharacterized protein n=1 Tax=Thermoascus crustaceus TaxID=5088 RepID=UPI003742154B